MSTRSVAAIAALSFVAVSALGCSSAAYKGASPSVRSFTEAPQTRDMYVGMNWKFSLDRADDYHAPMDLSRASTAALPASSGGNALSSVSGN